MGCSEMKLSIIIPVYNMQAYLERCLDSVVAALDGLKYTAEVLLLMTDPQIDPHRSLQNTVKNTVICINMTRKMVDCQM